jgi:hypothetical protein
MLPIPIQDYRERGGLRWGQSFWNAANASWPFASLRIAPGLIEIDLNAWPFFSNQFLFTSPEVTRLQRVNGLISSGVQIEHLQSTYPPFILFWSFDCQAVLREAKAAGFPVVL